MVSSSNDSDYDEMARRVDRVTRLEAISQLLDLEIADAKKEVEEYAEKLRWQAATR